MSECRGDPRQWIREYQDRLEVLGQRAQYVQQTVGLVRGHAKDDVGVAVTVGSGDASRHWTWTSRRCRWTREIYRPSSPGPSPRLRSTQPVRFTAHCTISPATGRRWTTSRATWTGAPRGGRTSGTGVMSDETGTFRFDHDVVLREAANLESAGGSLRFLLDHHGEGLGDRDLGAVSSDFVASVRGSIEELSDAVRTLGDVIVETGQRLHDQARRIAEAEDQTVAAMTKIGEGFGGHP